jgi:hypothetical protein
MEVMCAELIRLVGFVMFNLVDYIVVYVYLIYSV